MLKFSAVSQIWKKYIQKLNDWDLPLRQFISRLARCQRRWPVSFASRSFKNWMFYFVSLLKYHQIQLIQQIEQVQRQAARFATGNYYSRDPGCVTNMLNKLQWEPLQHRRAKSKVTMLYKIIHHEVEIPIHHLLVTNTRVTRGTQANNIRQISTRVDVYKYSFVPSCMP